jgi:3-methyladenine DNA glycosylase Tag
MKEIPEEGLKNLAPHSWCDISRECVLSEELIRKNKDKVYWINISKYQKLSEDFIIEFQDSIQFEWLIENKELENYSESFQRFILMKIIDLKEKKLYYKVHIIPFLTKYMKEQYEKLSIML